MSFQAQIVAEVNGIQCSRASGKGSGVWPSMVTHTWNLCSAFNPSKCTHTVVNIHLEQWSANAAAPGEQLGVRCLAQGSHLSRGIEGGDSAGYSLPPPTIPARPEIRTHDLQVTSPTLYPLGHDCPVWLSPCLHWTRAARRDKIQ